MNPIKKVVLGDKQAESSINANLVDLYAKGIRKATSTETEEWTALTTTAAKLTYLARKLGLEAE